MARRKLVTGRVQLWGHPIAVDWAEPEEDVDDDVMQSVKVQRLIKPYTLPVLGALRAKLANRNK